MDKELNAKVKRWKLMIQEYDFKWEYIKGEDNVVADQASRLIERDGEEDPELVRPCKQLLVKKTMSKALAQLQELDEEDLCMLSEFDLPPGVYDLISKVHEAEVGHGGVDRTMIKLRKLVKALKRKPWKYMREHVRRFIRDGPCCQKMSYLMIPIHTHPFTVASYEPFESLEMNTIGPLPEKEEVYKYILVVIDCFTR